MLQSNTFLKTGGRIFLIKKKNSSIQPPGIFLTIHSFNKLTDRKPATLHSSQHSRDCMDAQCQKKNPNLKRSIDGTMVF